MNKTQRRIIDAAIRELNQRTKLCYIMRKEPNKKAEVYLWEAPIVRAPKKLFFEQPPTN